MIEKNKSTKSKYKSLNLNLIWNSNEICQLKIYKKILVFFEKIRENFKTRKEKNWGVMCK